MTAVVTNVPIRLFVHHDSVQCQKVRALFDLHAESSESLWIADFVVLELALTLDRIYDIPRAEICAALKALAGNATASLESGLAIEQSMALYENGPAGFADCLLAVKARRAGCNALPIFDKKMKTKSGVRLQ